jgi:hypothetical protein
MSTDLADSNNPALIRLGFYILTAIILGIYTAIKTIHRRQSMNTFAAEHQFEHLGSELVDGLYLRKTSFAWSDLKVTNSLKGFYQGKDMAVFDASFPLQNANGRGARRVTQTVLAFRREGSLASNDLPSTGQDNLHIEIAGDWLICFTDGVHIPAQDLEAQAGEWYQRAAHLAQSRTYPRLDS